MDRSINRIPLDEQETQNPFETSLSQSNLPASITSMDITQDPRGDESSVAVVEPVATNGINGHSNKDNDNKANQESDADEEDEKEKKSKKKRKEKKTSSKQRKSKSDDEKKEVATVTEEKENDDEKTSKKKKKPLGKGKKKKKSETVLPESERPSWWDAVKRPLRGFVTPVQRGQYMKSIRRCHVSTVANTLYVHHISRDAKDLIRALTYNIDRAIIRRMMLNKISGGKYHSRRIRARDYMVAAHAMGFGIVGAEDCHRAIKLPAEKPSSAKDKNKPTSSSSSSSSSKTVTT